MIFLLFVAPAHYQIRMWRLAPDVINFQVFGLFLPASHPFAHHSMLPHCPWRRLPKIYSTCKPHASLDRYTHSASPPPLPPPTKAPAPAPTQRGSRKQEHVLACSPAKERNGELGDITRNTRFLIRWVFGAKVGHILEVADGLCFQHGLTGGWGCEMSGTSLHCSMYVLYTNIQPSSAQNWVFWRLWAW